MLWDISAYVLKAMLKRQEFADNLLELRIASSYECAQIMTGDVKRVPAAKVPCFLRDHPSTSGHHSMYMTTSNSRTTSSSSLQEEWQLSCDL